MSFFEILLHASSASCRAGNARARPCSHSLFIALALSAIFCASASETATIFYSLSAVSVSEATTFSFSSVSFPVCIRIGCKSSSSFYIFPTLDSVSTKQSKPLLYLFLRSIISFLFSASSDLNVLISSK
jgi:hypothetical protein